MEVKTSYSELISNAGLLTLSSFSSKILIFLLVPLYTSVLSKEAYGFYDVTYTTILIVFPLITADIISSIMRFCLDKDNNQREVISIGLRIWGTTTIVVSVILLANIVFAIIRPICGYEVYILLLYISYSFHHLLIQTCKGLEKIKVLAVSGVIGTLSIVLCNILFLLFLKWGLEGFYISTILGETIPSIYVASAIGIHKYCAFNINESLQKRMIMYSLPLALNEVGWLVNNNIDKYVVTWLVGLETNGLLSVAYKIPNVLTVIGGIFFQAWQISAVKEYATKENISFYNSIYKFYNIALLFITCFLILFTKFISVLLFQKEFFDAWIFVPFLLIGCLFTQIASYYGPILSAQYNSKAIAVSVIVGVVVNIVLNISLAKLIGPVGVAVATAISSFIIYMVTRRYVLKTIKIEENLRLYFSWGIVCCLALCVTLDLNIAVSVFLFGILVLLYRSDIKLLWKTTKNISKLRLKGKGLKQELIFGKKNNQRK